MPFYSSNLQIGHDSHCPYFSLFREGFQYINILANDDSTLQLAVETLTNLTGNLEPVLQILIVPMEFACIILVIQ